MAITRPKNKRNWKELRSLYLSGKYPDLVEFAKGEGLPYSSVTKQAMKGRWNEQSKAMEQKTLEKVAQSQALKIIAFNDKKEKLGQELQVKGKARLKVAAYNALDVIKAGIRFEGEAIGADRDAEAPSVNNIQTNIYFNEAVEIVENDDELKRKIVPLLKKALGA